MTCNVASRNATSCQRCQLHRPRAALSHCPGPAHRARPCTGGSPSPAGRRRRVRGRGPGPRRADGGARARALRARLPGPQDGARGAPAAPARSLPCMRPHHTRPGPAAVPEWTRPVGAARGRVTRTAARPRPAVQRCVAPPATGAWPATSPYHTPGAQVDLHYNGFCNSVLWQLFHYVPLNIDSKLSETRTLQFQWAAHQARRPRLAPPCRGPARALAQPAHLRSAKPTLTLPHCAGGQPALWRGGAAQLRARRRGLGAGLPPDAAARAAQAARAQDEGAHRRPPAPRPADRPPLRRAPTASCSRTGRVLCPCAPAERAGRGGRPRTR